METLKAYQYELLDNIRRFEINFKKTPKERIKIPFLETRLDLLEQMWNDFRTGHKEVVARFTGTKKEEPYFAQGNYEVFEDKYLELKTDIKQLLLVLTVTPPAKGQSTKNSSNQDGQEKYLEVKLPKLQLPVFSGKYEEWESFYDLFLSTIHNNKQLGSVQKLKYLKSYLSGEAQTLLSHYPTTDANYQEAWNLLVSRYANKRYNCNSILKTLFAQKKITNESAFAIKQLLDTTSTCLQSLDNMNIPTNNWDPIVIYFVVTKLDPESIKQWEQRLSANSDSLPTWKELKVFLESRFRCLEMIDTNSSRVPQVRAGSKAQAFLATDSTLSEKKCVLCSEQHYVYHCYKFSELTPQERYNFVKQNNLCFNCLSHTHTVVKCRQSTNCRRCGRRHHTLLHFERRPTTHDGNNEEEGQTTSRLTTSAASEVPADSVNYQQRGDVEIVSNFVYEDDFNVSDVLLATARVKATNRTGYKQTLRVLLDQGSQANFVTESTVQLLGLARKPVHGFVSGLGDGHTAVKYVVSFNIESCHNSDSSFNVDAYVLHKLTSILPSTNLQTPEWLEINSLPLADPQYTTPGRIEILLGAEIYSEILRDGIIKHPRGNLLAQNTFLGWIISGRLSRNKMSTTNVTNLHIRINDDNNLLKQFWEIENEPNSISKLLTKTEQRCEEIYDKTTTRNENGKYVVRLPFKDKNPKCKYSNSKDVAINRFMMLERKLAKNPELKVEYTKVIQEYINLNHMELVADDEIDNPAAVYLPHHAVIRDDKETSKVRIVFDASCKYSNKVSLNDDLLVGPKLQQDLRHILMRWRTHKITLVSDIIKMYRMVLLATVDTDYQRIVWRNDTNQQLQHYKLLRLTFGTASAPYLAVKTLQRLADDEKSNYPTAAKITKKDFYIDDLMTGCDSVDEGIKIYNEMNKLMQSGGFELQKWTSNSEDLMRYIKNVNESNETKTHYKINNLIKVLGISWNRETDEFEYVINLTETNTITKRKVLSDVARLYDPMGWIAPTIVLAKIFIQKLWVSGLGWDDSLTNDLLNEWLTLKNSLIDLKGLHIPRWYHTTSDSKIELHAFADASKSAFGAAVYIRVVTGNDVYVRLVTAKTKVAPIEKELSIPRLELCGADLATKLINEVAQVMDVHKENLHAWSDSTIVLAWLKGGPSKWNTFVSNRVSNILNILEYSQWGHVSTTMNPADCSSRGLLPRDLISHSIWWYGPQWLSDIFLVNNHSVEIKDTNLEEKTKAVNILTITATEQLLCDRFSNLNRLVKVVGYCRRFLNLMVPKRERILHSKSLSFDEMKTALQRCIQMVQNYEYGEQIRQLKGNKLPKRSKLCSLNPFLDKNGILRVGGRINQADAEYDTRHPIIIPDKSHFTKLIILDAHYKTLHGGPQLMLNYLRTKYWIIRGKDQVKRVYRNCVTCARHSTKSNTQFMGQIPEVRLKPSKPFKSTGVDYAGPINVRFSPGRGAKSYKGYICLFICMVTRAIHLEAVTDLTAKGFIAAFRRFTSRRGHCENLYSDNGTNFVGANKMLKEMFTNAKSSLSIELTELLNLERTTWHFIPPYAPNFGGLWEAGVRSTKQHLLRVIGTSTLTYEELSTVLYQIEACLNSRPLSLLSSNADDPLPLTPGHFLVGEPLLTIADENYTDCNITGLDRWRLTQKMVNDFWKRWYKEYLVTLNQRHKWNSINPQPNINDIVVLKEDNIPPAKWMLGRIVETHTGPDNITRVVSVKCKHGVLKRPISKISILSKADSKTCN